MSRLTARDPDGKAYFIECRNNPKCKKGCGDYKCNLIERAAAHLADYEDLEYEEAEKPDTWSKRIYRAFMRGSER